MGRNSVKSKFSLVKEHLENKKPINPINAFALYGVTRLSALIYVLRYKHQWVINSTNVEMKDNLGNTINCAEYRLKSTIRPSIKQVPVDKSKKK